MPDINISLSVTPTGNITLNSVSNTSQIDEIDYASILESQHHSLLSSIPKKEPYQDKTIRQLEAEYIYAILLGEELGRKLDLLEAINESDWYQIMDIQEQAQLDVEQLLAERIRAKDQILKLKPSPDSEENNSDKESFFFTRVAESLIRPSLLTKSTTLPKETSETQESEDSHELLSDEKLFPMKIGNIENDMEIVLEKKNFKTGFILSLVSIVLASLTFLRLIPNVHDAINNLGDNTNEVVTWILGLGINLIVIVPVFIAMWVTELVEKRTIVYYLGVIAIIISVVDVLVEMHA